MKNTSIFISLIFALVSTSQANSTTPVRQAKLTAKIEKVVFVTGDNGMPSWVATPVCTKQSLMNVYKDDSESWSSLTPADLKLIQCNGELAGKQVSITVGGALGLFQKSYAGTLLPMKGVALFLSWGDLDMESLKIVHSPSSDPWLNFQDVLAPVSTGKIVDGIPQPPEPSEYFTAVVNIEDEIR